MKLIPPEHKPLPEWFWMYIIIPIEASACIWIFFYGPNPSSPYPFKLFILCCGVFLIGYLTRYFDVILTRKWKSRARLEVKSSNG